MAEKLTSFVWRNSAREQLVLLAITVCSFPVIWISLELPKIIINDAIGGTGFPREIYGFELEQTEFLLALCFAYLAAIAVNNGVKFLQNMQRGILGERMLRRMRFDLYRRVMGRPLRRLKTTSPGELVQMISAELAPIGDFIGAILVTPVAQGGTFIVLLAFIVVQNPLIGAAAIMLYPVQAYIVPKLQAKVVAMIRLRLINIRAMAREISESVDGATEVQALGARRWHMAVVSRQLYDNYKIRRRIFILKFLIKFVNNIANHLTPFFIFLIGGWFVIQGQLDIGALTAVLIAYKDLANPWKELLTYYQDFSDMTARYVSVMENFDEDGQPRPLPETAPVGPHALALTEAELPGFARPVSCHVPKRASREVPLGASVAVMVEDPADRSTLLQALAGLGPRAADTWTAGTPVLYRAAAFVPADPHAFTGSLRDNLLQGLRFRPVAEGAEDDPDRALRRREAGLTGAPEDDIADEWIDPVEAGYPDMAAVQTRMLALAARLGLEDDLYSIGLESRLTPEDQPTLAAALLELRQRIAESGELGEMRADFIDVWAEDRYVPNATLAENLFFALPAQPGKRWPDYAADREVRRALDAADALGLMLDLGVDICEALISLFEGVGAESDLLRRFSLFPRSETGHIETIVRRARAKGPLKLPRADQARMLAAAFDYSSARFRLGVVRKGDRMDRLLAARKRLRKLCEADPRFLRIDPQAYMPAFTLAENVFFGPVKADRRDAWAPFKTRIDVLMAETGLRQPILRAGLDQTVGEGGAGLNAMQRRKLGLARALMKNPGALVLETLAGGDSDADRALRALLLDELKGGALVWGATRAEALRDADHVIRIDAGGRVTEGAPDGA